MEAAEATEEIYRYSQGIPRLVNLVRDVLFSLGSGAQLQEIGRICMKQAIKKLSVEQPNRFNIQRTGTESTAPVVSPGGFKSLNGGDPQGQSNIAALPILPSGTWNVRRIGARDGWRVSWRAISMGIAAGLVIGLMLGGMFALREKGKRSSAVTEPMSLERRQPSTAAVSNDASQAKDSVGEVMVLWEDDISPVSDDSESANLATQVTKRAVRPPPLTDVDRVLQSVETWRAAWQAQSVAGYVDHYTAAFRPANGQSRETWVRTRRVKLTQPKTLSLRLDNLEVQRLDNQRYKVTFRQRYQSDIYQDVVTKELTFIKVDDRYLIEQERVL